MPRQAIYQYLYSLTNFNYSDLFHIQLSNFLMILFRVPRNARMIISGRHYIKLYNYIVD